MSYLDELLAGYRQGLAYDRPTPIAAARVALNCAVDPNQRGRLLAVVAKALAASTLGTSANASAGVRPRSRIQ